MGGDDTCPAKVPAEGPRSEGPETKSRTDLTPQTTRGHILKEEKRKKTNLNSLYELVYTLDDTCPAKVPAKNGHTEPVFKSGEVGIALNTIPRLVLDIHEGRTWP